MPEVASGNPVRLVDLSRRILDAQLTAEQQAQRYSRAKAEGTLSVAASVKFYIPFIAENTSQLVNLGGGMFRLPTDEDLNEDDVEDAAVDAGVADAMDEGADFGGWIYAFSYPAIQHPDRAFPIKVGRTTSDIDSRVNVQCKNSAVFENPIVLGRWKVERVGAMEVAVQNVLKARGKWRENVPGKEWFDTTISEIEEIIAFVSKSAGD
jgi:hypothetical protein